MCKYRIGCMVLCVLLLLAAVPFAGVVSADEVPTTGAADDAQTPAAAGSYVAYIEQYKKVKTPKATIAVPADNQVALQGSQLVQEDVEGRPKNVLTFAPGSAASLQVRESAEAGFL